MNSTRKVFGIILLSFSFFGVIACLSFIFNLDLVSKDFVIFHRGDEGGASNTPIFFGLCALAGAYLLGNVKDDNNPLENRDLNQAVKNEEKL